MGFEDLEETGKGEGFEEEEKGGAMAAIVEKLIMSQREQRVK